MVAQASPQRLVEMFEVMGELEAMCARLATRRITDSELQMLETVHERCRAASGERDPDAYFYANEEFHRAIYAAAHNTFLADQAQSLQRKLRPYRRLQLRVRNRVQRSFDEHESIVDAIRAGNVEQAMLAVRNHVIVQGERFADLLSSMQQMGNLPPALANVPASMPASATRASAAAASSAA